MPYLVRVLYALDCFLNALTLDGAEGQTISTHAATAARDGKRWGCIACRLLSWTVERDHCGKTLAGVAISRIGGLRAGALILAAGTLLAALYIRLL